MIPIRCYTCNKVVTNKYELYKKMREENILSSKEILEDRLKLDRWCCKKNDSILMLT